MQNAYEAKREARIERMIARAERLERFAEGKDLSLYGEAKSGIPIGQPILVGHHSERRHRRHLERIERLVRAGYDASAKAKQIRERVEGIKLNRAIQIDNPDAKALLVEKLQKLESERDKYKKCNRLMRMSKGNQARLVELIEENPDLGSKDPKTLAENLLKRDFAGRIGVPDYVITNLGGEIRRLRKRLETIDLIQKGFEPFEIGLIKVEFVEGQIQIEFPAKPSEATRTSLKSLSFKWSGYSKRWVRKHTDTTSGQWFKKSLREVLEMATYG